MSETVLIQKLVDGELSAKDRGELLRSLERDSPLWRQIALAFVEEQIFGGEIAAEERVAPRKTAIPPSSPVSRRWAAGIGLSLVLMLGLGYCAGKWSGRLFPLLGSANSSSLADAKQTPGEPNGPKPGGAKGDANRSQPRYRLQLRDAKDSAAKAVELPVYEQSQANLPSHENLDPATVEKLNRQLEDWGYRVDWRTEYLSGKLDDGRQVIVPVRQAAVEYYGQ